MPGKDKKPALQRAKELCEDNAPLEEGDHWFAVATPWWEDFQDCKPVDDAPSVRNDSLIDKPLSSKSRKVSVLKPKLEEGRDFVFVPESSWEVIARELNFDWEIRREVVYQRSQQELQIEAYPLAFKIFYWSNGDTEAKELVDDAGRAMVVLASRAHTLGQLLTEVWLAAPEDFRQKFPQFLSGIIDSTSSISRPAVSENPGIRACYHTRRPGDGEEVWVPIEKMMKRVRAAPTSLRLKPRAKKRQARDEDEESAYGEQSEDGDGEQSEAEFDEHASQLKGDRSGLSTLKGTKLGDLRLDNRSEIASGPARIHELLVEQKLQGASTGEMGWPSQGLEMQWRMSLAKGDFLDALDTSKTWFEARVLAARRNKVHVHYRSWEPKWDEWISRTSTRIAPLHSKVPKWRSLLRTHSLVQVGIEVPNLRHPKWRNATVIEVVPSTDGEAASEEDGAGLRVHVQVDEDDIWLPANDDLLCRPNTHNESKPLSKIERQLLAHDDTLPSDSSEVAEEATAELEHGDDGNDEHDVVEVDGDEDEDENGDGGGEDGEVGLVGHDGSSSPPLRAPRSVEVTTASRSGINLRARVGPARDLNASFSQAKDQGLSSAGRTPARGRSRSRTQASSDDTSPELVSPTSQLSACQLRTLWAQVGNDLQALHTSWGRLGESLMAIMDAPQASERSEN
ncbi:hypothetical protein PF003_g18374 [Phytophthora fragariae]|nr:hypothetical protein PF003_g18374 [Phytophthora fragariae]